MKEKRAYTQKEDIVQGVYNEHLYTPGDESTKSIGFKTSSGTTGRGVALVIERSNTTHPLYLTHGTPRALIRVGMQLCNTMSNMNTMLRIHKVDRMLCLENEDLRRDDIKAIITEFAPSDIMIAPVGSLLEFIDVFANAFPPSLERIYLGGDFISERELAELQQKLPAQIYLVNDYALSETGTLGYSCPYVSKKYAESNLSYVHPLPGVEVDTVGNDEENPSELVVNSPTLGWYKTGDACRIINHTCPCGIQSTIEIHGRIDYDWVAVGGAVFYAHLVKEKMAMFSEEICDYRMYVAREYNSRNEEHGYMNIEIVLAKKPENMERLKQDVIRALYTLKVAPTKSLGDVVEMEVFNPLTVSVVQAIEKRGVKEVRLQRVPLQKIKD